ncbi:transposase [Mesotoga sp. TolDC]|uniref:transposase n=1 Tax=Mesotoga sp. TolDC TaxID=1389250 RepID=UPI0021ABBAF3|nr:transposase [Mesotoga sp. TolDC]
MEHNERLIERRSIRLKEYDYSRTGAYFLTICTYRRQCLLGTMVDGRVILSSIGKIVVEEWLRSAEVRKEIELDAFVIMPNHLHAIVAIHRGERQIVSECLEAERRAMKAKTIGSFVSRFKAAATVRANELHGTPGKSIWQRNYYEHVIRSEKEQNRC